MNVAAESHFGWVRGATREHILYGTVSEERQGTRTKGPQPGGFLRKWQHPEFFKRLLGGTVCVRICKNQELTPRLVKEMLDFGDARR